MYRGIELWPKEMTKDMITKQFLGKEAIQTYPNLPKNIYESFVRTAKRLPDKEAVVDHLGKTYTYRDLQKKVEQCALWLWNRQKIHRGSHVALLMYNSIEFCVIFLALNKIGAVVIPLPSKYRQQEIQSLIDKSNVNFIISDEYFKDYFQKYIVLGIEVCLIPDGEKGYALDGFVTEEERNEIGEQVTEEDLALLVFTSGTTSQSKGVMLHNFQIMHAIVSYERTLGITEADRAIIPIPIYLITGLVAIFGLLMHVGGTVYLNKFFDGRRVLEDVKKYKITFLHASPTVFSLLLQHREEFLELPSLRMFACGSSNMPPGKIRLLHEWLPTCEFRTIYGLTETTSPATVFPEDANKSSYIGSSGRPIPGLECKIQDHMGRELLDGEQGEIWVRGSNITMSYYRMHSNAFLNGWLNTGDIGYFNKEGYLYIVDRMKDMINRGGEKICSFDVENELLNMDGVEDAAVVGIADELYGEVPVAVIKPRPQCELSENMIKESLKKRMAGYKIPVHILFVDTIPVTDNMKTDKKRIRQLFTKEL